MIMHIEGPLVEEPFIPEQWNNPPEIPYERFAVRESVDQLLHVMVAKAPVTEINIVEEDIVDSAQNQDSDSSEPEASPGINIGNR